MTIYVKLDTMITGLQITMMAQLKNAKHIGDIDMAKHKGKVRFSAPLEPKKVGVLKNKVELELKKPAVVKKKFFTQAVKGVDQKVLVKKVK